MSIGRIPTNNNLKNIPHMLRNLADEMERGETPTPRSLMLISHRSGDVPPDIFAFGDTLTRVEEVGIFATCMMMSGNTERS